METNRQLEFCGIVYSVFVSFTAHVFSVFFYMLHVVKELLVYNWLKDGQ